MAEALLVDVGRVVETMERLAEVEKEVDRDPEQQVQIKEQQAHPTGQSLIGQRVCHRLPARHESRKMREAARWWSPGWEQRVRARASANSRQEPAAARGSSVSSPAVAVPLCPR